MTSLLTTTNKDHEMLLSKNLTITSSAGPAGGSSSSCSSNSTQEAASYGNYVSTADDDDDDAAEMTMTQTNELYCQQEAYPSAASEPYKDEQEEEEEDDASALSTKCASVFSCASKHNTSGTGLAELRSRSSFGSLGLFSSCGNLRDRAEGEEDVFELDKEQDDSTDLKLLQSCINGTTTGAGAGYYSDGEINTDLKVIVQKKKLVRRRRKQEKKRNIVLLPPSFSTGSIAFASSVYDYTEEEMLMPNGDLPTPASELRPRITISKVLVTSGGKVCSKQKEKSVATVHCRSFHVVTTAALPWLTGTAVNPLLRAAYLNQMNRRACQQGNLDLSIKLGDTHQGSVTLVIPWLVDSEDRQELFGERYSFQNEKEQEEHIRSWLRESAKLTVEADIPARGGIHIQFYPAKYHAKFKSIIPLAAISVLIEKEDADVCILEEPEHLNVMLNSTIERWNQKFNHVVGVIHTNYKAYLEGELGSLFSSLGGKLIPPQPLLHCDKIVKLSATLQKFASEKEIVSNVHGIRGEFLEEGKRRASSLLSKYIRTGSTSQVQLGSGEDRVYFIGKILWAKGFDKLLALETIFKRATGSYFPIHIYGSGPDQIDVQRAFMGRNKPKRSGSMDDHDVDLTAKEMVKEKIGNLLHDIPKSRFELRRDEIPAFFHGRTDHSNLKKDCKIFVNPSITEVLCTTTAEALGMNKFVIIPHHPSNIFFEQFPNCLMYNNPTEFVSNLQYAIANDPRPLSPNHYYALTWEAATERLYDASIVTQRDAHRSKRLVGISRREERAKEIIDGPLMNAVRRMIYQNDGETRDL